MISFNRRFFKQIDWWLIGAILLLTLIGIVVIDGTTHGVATREGYAKRQMMWWGVGLFAFVVILLIDYSQLIKLAVPAYLVCLVLLAGLLLNRSEIKGASSWYNLGIVRLQPSELTKIATVLVVASYLSWIKKRLPGWLDMVMVGVIVGLPVGFILLQPDLGTAATFMPLVPIMPWVAGARRRIYIILCTTVIVIVVIYGSVVVAQGGDYPGLKPYQELRINAFLSRLIPMPGYDLHGDELAQELQEKGGWAPLQARIAFGSGGLFGKGWRNGTQTHMEFLPEAHTDYIFASCGEQFGLIGCAVVLALYVFIIYRALYLALRAKDWFGYFIVIGFLCIFMTHVFLNTGVAMDLLPVTGLPLPFLSAGGSFLLTMYIGFGLIVNVGMRKYMFLS